jgi:glutathione synthase/RimK-type ligase-like ATP-grasp enzyme
MPRVLIVGQLPDPHIDAVVRELEGLGAEPVLFDRASPEKSRLTYRLEEGQASGEILTARSRVRLSELDAVWWRVKPFTPAQFGAEPTPVIAGFVEREWRSALDSLVVFTPQAFWVNPRAADFAAREKPTQLRVAQEAGLAIPPTRISNDPDVVADFLGRGENCIYKPITWYVDIPDRFIFTSQVELDQVQHGAEEIQVAPGIFQRKVHKAYEVRVTVIGESFFAVKIDSQALTGAELDWRREQHRLCYTPDTLPDDICHRLLAVHRELGLIYGAYDLIVTPEGEHVFLEVNPSGQWLWLELRTGLPISRELAHCLARDCVSAPGSPAVARPSAASTPA